jgi:hypothetical protein
MSTPEIGPYKSRLFNFFNRQSLQLKERLEKTGRNVKVALEWGVQILLYPMYLLVQTGRMAGRQLGKTVERAKLSASSSPTETQSSATTSDRPIEQVLEAIALLPTIAPESSSDRIKPLNESPEHRLPPTIQGVACHLQTRHLVLATSNEEILDSLSPQQQKDLQKLIYWEVANYWYERRLRQKTANRFLKLVLPSEQNSEYLLPPARVFWDVISWVQTSPVAIAIDLFGESTLVESHPSVSIAKVSTPIQEIRKHERLSLPSQVGTFTPRHSKTSLENLQEIVEAAIEYFLHKRSTRSLDGTSGQSQQAKNLFPPAIGDRFSQWRQKLQARFLNLSQTPTTSAPDSLQIQALIQAAIDYFFGQQSDKFQFSGDKAVKALSSSQAGGAPENSDPWLIWDDFCTQTETKQRLGNFAPSQLPPTATEPVPSNRSPRDRSVPDVKQPNSIIKDEPTDRSIEVEPDWIETQATPVGYVKHPLEKILEWLDRSILWIEETITSLWRWLRQRL